MKWMLLVFLMLGSLPAMADVYVHGYTRSDGTYVEPHYRSDPNSNPYDNWSTKGNVNPYTGQSGYKNPNMQNSYNNSYNNGQNQQLYPHNN